MPESTLEVPDAVAASSLPLAAPSAAPQLPAGSTITVLTEADGKLLTLILPRTGFRGTALAFLIFSSFWNLVSWGVFSVFLIDTIRHPSFDSALLLLFMLLFVAVGILTAAASIQFAYRKSVIVATPDALVITQAGPFRKSDAQWAPADLSDICVGPSGTKINGVPVPELQIHSKNQKIAGFFDGRTDNELAYLAASLCTYYSVTPPPKPAADDDSNA